MRPEGLISLSLSLSSFISVSLFSISFDFAISLSLSLSLNLNLSLLLYIYRFSSCRSFAKERKSDRKIEITENITCTLLFLGVEQRTISTVGCGGIDVTLGCCSADFARANPSKRPIWTSKERSSSKSKERSAFTVVDTGHTRDLVCTRPQIAATGLESTEIFEPSVDKIHKLALKMQVPLTCVNFNLAKLPFSPLFGQKGRGRRAKGERRQRVRGGCNNL